MAHKHIHHAPIINIEKGRRAAIRRCTETGEWVVYFYRANGDDGSGAPLWQYLGETSNYYTDDKEDAFGTASHYVK